jgi:hypothetical protein
VPADAVDGRRLPIATYDPDRTRRVGRLGVVPTGAVLDCDTGTNRGFGACLVYDADAARCFTIAEVRSGKAFALVVEQDGTRVIGLVPDGPTRVVVTAHGAAAAPQIVQNTVDALVKGLRPTDEIRLELDRQSAQVLVLNQSGTPGRAESEATRLRARLSLEVTAVESDVTRAATVVSSTSTMSNGLARKAARLFEGALTELAPAGTDFRPTTPGVIVALGRDRMR